MNSTIAQEMFDKKSDIYYFWKYVYWLFSINISLLVLSEIFNKCWGICLLIVVDVVTSMVGLQNLYGYITTLNYT